ncbi:MAG TPA: hypothetical protein VKY53_03360 [Marinobacter sp.]|nr:hypothetical protein [Marinobacter sp.]
MKKLVAMTLLSGLVASPFALAAGSFDDAEKAIKAGLDYNMTHFRSIEVDDDRDMEIEGWLDDGMYVELDLDHNATIEKEKRRKHDGEIWGLSADDVRAYLEAAHNNGMATIDELEVKANGHVEVEGEDQNGQDLDIRFRVGDRTPVKVDRN